MPTHQGKTQTDLPPPPPPGGLVPVEFLQVSSGIDPNTQAQLLTRLARMGLPGPAMADGGDDSGPIWEILKSHDDSSVVDGGDDSGPIWEVLRSHDSSPMGPPPPGSTQKKVRVKIRKQGAL